MNGNIIYEILLISSCDGAFSFQRHLNSSIFSANLNMVNSPQEGIDFINKNRTHIIFLAFETNLKDSLEELQKIYSFTRSIPIVVIGNELNTNFRIECLQKGASDYLITAHLDSFSIYNALRQNLDRPNYFNDLAEVKSRYRQLFHMSPQPIFVYDLKTLRITDANKAARIKYGYSYKEFLSITLSDIKSEKKVPIFLKTAYEQNKDFNKSYRGIFKHRTKGGDVLDVAIHSNLIKFSDEPARIVIAIDITKQLNIIKAVKDQNKQLQEIAWTQSHMVRAPLVRIMSLVYMLNENFDEDSDFYLREITSSAEDLDRIIHEITEKTTQEFEI
ncbi:PAS domain S-box protein [Zunongwangia endophytica]|uniref:PAS domain S-box protein n=1 Tax=Zunongwangia endophytica TaxID=1808945 RepID=A0ABV8HEX6_9FLAO|nr:PAS domain S-box protein [Zunongwangia endophytica]MDN3593429.1 PAS domain S-box protein [Zunongwangia endophytica]